MVPYIRRNSEQSRDAALAAFAAWDQGKFWEMHDLLYGKAPNLDRKSIKELARTLGLDLEKFEKSLDDQQHLGVLQENLERVHALDIWSTPTVIINGSLIKSTQPYEHYRDMIEEALYPDRKAGLPKIEHSEIPLFVNVPRLRPTNALKVGDEAPDFTLPSTLDKDITLRDYRWGKGRRNVLLVFLPAAFTPV
jgi:hypothetical protein